MRLGRDGIDLDTLLACVPGAPGMRPIPLLRTSNARVLVLTFGAIAVAGLMLLPNASVAGMVASVASVPASAVGGATVGGSHPFHPTVVKSSVNDWPELHQTPALNGYASNSALSSLNASKLGVAWATDLYGAALDSPVVAYDPLLGETLAYIGTDTGNVMAINIANGQVVWGVWLGSPIRSSPLVSNGSVFVGTFTNPAIFRLNATTGSTICSRISPSGFESTPTLATPPGGVPTLYFGTLGNGPRSGPFLAINAGNCTIEWEFTGFNQSAGSWNSASYGVTKSGLPLVLLGTDNPDSSVYALDALTGTEVWRFQAYNPGAADFDVAAGAAISPPGKFGFSQGAVFVTNKANRAYALDLNNGTLIWENNFNNITSTTGVSRSTPALDGTNVIFGEPHGLLDLNATNGAVFWNYRDPTSTESIASPAIAGGHGHGIVITGDVGGDLDVVAVTTGAQLFTYQTGGYITASPAVSGSNILEASSNGYLYDFAPGGGNDSVLPTTAITSPAPGATLANPNGNLTVVGTATDPKSVAAVDVAVQSGGTGGPWWDATSRSWSPGPVDSTAVLGTPGGKSTSWSYSFPVPPAGGTYEVIAYAVSSSGQSDLHPAYVSFPVTYSTVGPHLEPSSSFVAPGSSVTVKGGGFGGSEKVKLTFESRLLSTVTAAANGSLPSTKVSIPSSAAFGLSTLTATGQTTGRTTTAAITVANDWEQLGYATTHTGFEPNDPVLNTLVFPGGDNWITLAWHFDAGAPINASPVVADGVAYVADTVGNLFALRIANGGLLWNFTLTSGAAIDGAPAVDPTLGLVFIGATDGTLDAVFASNGTLDWSTSVGGNVSAPIYSGGTVYVTSSSGKVEALSESTGSRTWSVTLANSVLAAAALNGSVHLLVVGESNGDVVGLNSSNGATSWTYATGGRVTAPALLSGGTVYVGSDDHKFYAIDQLTGKLAWSFKTGGPVRDTGTLDSVGLLYIGSDDGHLYVLHASSGKEDFNFSIGSAIVGVSSANGVAVYEDANGVIGAEKTYVHGGGWQYQTGAGLVTAPVILDGTVYVCGEDGFLYAFTPIGQPPD